MKGIKKGLAILLVLCTLLSVVFVTGAAPMPQSADADQVQTAAENGNVEYKIVHLDCGRKYFSVDWIKALINEMAAAGYNQLELAFGNDGLRFLLDDMSFTANGTTYTHDAVVAAVENGNKAQNSSGDASWLTKAEMDDIIAAANAKGIQIVPLLNLPGHANAILDIFNDQYNASGSNNTFDVTNANGLNAAMAIFQKYVDYFHGKGCKFFNFGADEYANDASGSFSFNRLNDAGYTKFVEFVNRMASYIIGKDMTPRAFNDGMYYQGKTSSTPLDTSIQCCYWSNGWRNYYPAPASTVASNGHDMINTNGAYYYVLGKKDNFDSGYTYAAGWDNTTFAVDTKIENPVGSMFCIWCDYPNAETEQTIAANTRMTLRAMSARMDGERIDNLSTDVVPGGFNATGTINDGTSTPDPGYKEEPITVSVTVAVNATSQEYTQDGRVDTEGTYTTSDGIASYTIKHDTTRGERTVTQITSENGLTSGGQYLIESQRAKNNNRADTLLSDAASGDKLQLNGNNTNNSELLWTITKSNGSYLVQRNEQYLNISSGKASVQPESHNVSLSYKSSGGIFGYGAYAAWDISESNSHLNQYGGSDSTVAAGHNQGAADDMGSRWNIYKVTETPSLDQTTITFTGVAEGTTYVTVGDTKYTITVLPENLSGKTLTVEYWITNSRVTADDATSKTISASAVYSESGALLSDLVPATGKKVDDANADMVFWKGTCLDSNHKQTGSGGADQTAAGNDFTYIRYWDGNWAYSADGEHWTNVADGDQIVAYYLQKTEVTKEITTLVKDWGYAPNSQSGSENKVALTVAVVYPDGTVSPTEGNMYSTSTTLFNYWNNRDIGLVAPVNNSDYEISKITVTDGRRDQSGGGQWGTNDTITWEKTTNDAGEQWYNETTYWDESDGGAPMVNGAVDGIIWSNYNTAKLVLIYLKPVHYDTNLTVKWVDDSASGALISDMEVAVSSDGTPITFYDGLEQTSALPTAGVGGTFTLDDDAYVINSTGVRQYFSKAISTIPGVADQYKSGLYKYVSADLSADGMTLTLHYSIDASKLSKQYVIDFGLPVNIPLTDLVDNADDVKSVEVISGSATVNTSKSITYQPENVMSGIEAVNVRITFNNGTTQTARIGFVPATTVYYEESFGTFPAGSITGAPKADNQAAEAVGEKINNYGYDAAYLNNTKDSNGTVATLNAGGEGRFTFTGTGVDVYACTMENSGKVMIYVYQGTDLKRLITVDTRQHGDQSAKDTAYNVPIVSLSGLAHDEYTLVMKEVQTKLDNNSKVNLPVYIDGFRVHGTLDVVNTQVYKDDNEANPTFVELRNAVLAGLNVDTSKGEYAQQIAQNAMSQVYASSETTNGAVVLDANLNGTTINVQDLLDKGPKNELYLRNGQTVVFKIADGYDNVQVGLKALNGSVNYTMNGTNNSAFATSTDMFYKVTPDNDGVVAITNNGEGILSITEVKVIGASASTASVFAPLSANDLMPALLSMGFEAEPVAATATLNITVQCGDKAIPVTLTANGMTGDSHTFTAAEIKAAVEEVLPEGYNLDDASFADVTVAYGDSADASFTAAQTQIPDTPTSTIGKIIAVAKRVINRIIGWFR